MSVVTERFPTLNDEEKENILENVDAKNTKRSTATAVTLFRQYLTARNLSADFENCQDDQLDEALSSFYLEMRGKNGQLYKKSTLQAYRHGIQRHLQKTKPEIDLVNGEKFRRSAKSFKSMTKELKRQGKAAVEHYPAISDDDLETLYSYFSSNTDVQTLQYKVFVDIMLYFGRRGRENLAQLTRQDFAVTTDAGGQMYVYKTQDEKTKNHQDDSEKSADGRMYEIKESNRCPVRSFVKYIRMLNPECHKLFQQVRPEAKDGNYFYNAPIGHNKLGSFMVDISKEAGLSRAYTNHSLRSTTVKVLNAAQIPSRHIMTVTGHKSETSLKTYSGKTDEQTKKLMSHTISEKTKGKCDATEGMIDDIENVDLQLDNIQPLSDSQSANLMSDLFDDDDDDGIDDIMKSISLPGDKNVNYTVNNNNSQVISSNPVPRGLMQYPVLRNCQNITINYNFYPK